jgi:hypothetical protein
MALFGEVGFWVGVNERRSDRYFDYKTGDRSSDYKTIDRPSELLERAIDLFLPQMDAD